MCKWAGAWTLEHLDRSSEAKDLIDTSNYESLILTIVVLNDNQLQSLYVYERALKKNFNLITFFQKENQFFR